MPDYSCSVVWVQAVGVAQNLHGYGRSVTIFDKPGGLVPREIIKSDKSILSSIQQKFSTASWGEHAYWTLVRYQSE